MNWSYRLLTVAGIPIRVHVTFLLILLLGAYQWYGMVGTLGAAAFGATLMALLFVCVILHELGHSLVARAFQVPVREIILLPLGGVALMSKNPQKPVHELLIAIAGPLVNVLLAAFLLALLGLRAGPMLLSQRGLLPGGLGDTPSVHTALMWLFAANVSLFVFNLIPAFPLDGGRALRAVLAMFLGYRQGTRVAASLGQILAALLGVVGVLTGNFVLTLVAVFIFFGAGQETAQAEAKTVLDTLRVGDAYNKHALTLAVGDRMSRVVDFLLTSYQPDFAVLQGRSPIGIVTRNDVLAALAADSEDAFVTEVMRREFPRVDAAQTLESVHRALREAGARVAAVYDGANYLGLVGVDDIAEALAVQTFVQRQKARREAPA
jgi:Zn-dependent protease/predicted transcriptional regulator